MEVRLMNKEAHEQSSGVLNAGASSSIDLPLHLNASYIPHLDTPGLPKQQTQKPDSIFYTKTHAEADG